MERRGERRDQRGIGLLNEGVRSASGTVGSWTKRAAAAARAAARRVPVDAAASCSLLFPQPPSSSAWARRSTSGRGPLNAHVASGCSRVQSSILRHSAVERCPIRGSHCQSASMSRAGGGSSVGIGRCASSMRRDMVTTRSRLACSAETKQRDLPAAG